MYPGKHTMWLNGNRFCKIQDFASAVNSLLTLPCLVYHNAFQNGSGDCNALWTATESILKTSENFVPVSRFVLEL